MRATSAALGHTHTHIHTQMGIAKSLGVFYLDDLDSPVDFSSSLLSSPTIQLTVGGMMIVNTIGGRLFFVL